MTEKKIGRYKWLRRDLLILPLYLGLVLWHELDCLLAYHKLSQVSKWSWWAQSESSYIYRTHSYRNMMHFVIFVMCISCILNMQEKDVSEMYSRTMSKHSIILTCNLIVFYPIYQHSNLRPESFRFTHTIQLQNMIRNININDSIIILIISRYHGFPWRISPIG